MISVKSPYEGNIKEFPFSSVRSVPTSQSDDQSLICTGLFPPLESVPCYYSILASCACGTINGAEHLPLNFPMKATNALLCPQV